MAWKKLVKIKGEDGKTPIAGIDFPIPQNGKDGRDGRDGTDASADDIIAKLKVAKGDKRLPLSAIHGSEFLKKLDMNDQRWHGGGLTSVTTDGVTITGNGTPSSPLVGTAASDTYKVKYDAADPTGGYIADKFVAGTGITLAEGTGADENKLVITNAGGTAYLKTDGSTTGATSQAQVFTNGIQLTNLTASKVAFTDASKNLTSTGIGTSSQFIKGDGSLDSNTYLTAEADTLNSVLSRGNTSLLAITAGGIRSGSIGVDGQYSMYKHISAGVDWLTSINPNAAQSANFNIYLPPAAPAGTYLLNMTSGGVIGYDTNTYLTSSALTGYLQNNVGIAGGTTLIGGTAASNNLTLQSTSNATKGSILFGTSAYDEVNNRLGIGTASPTAVLHLKAGTATAGTAPLKINAGTVLGTTEAGAIENDGTHLYITFANAGTRYQLDQQSGSYTLPTASASVLGGVKIGARLTMTGDVLSADVQGGGGDTLAPATNTDLYIPQWNGANSKTLKDGLAVPAGGLAGITALNLKLTAPGGTSSQFIKGDGSLDSSTYLTSLSGALLATGATTGATSQAQTLTGGVVLGTNASVLGTAKFFGSTSGDVTLQPNAIAGTGIVLTLPATTGTVALTSQIVSQVEDSITDGHTTIAPSGNAVFDALALKAPLSSPTFTTDATTPIIKLSATSNQAVFQSAGVTGTLTWTPSSTNKTITFPNVTGTTALGTGTANEIAYWSATNVLGTLAVATYPSLTELSYVKGVTSAIQTQLNAKGTGNGDMLLGTAQSVTETKTFTKDKLLVKGTSTGTTNLTTANTSATSYTATFPAKDGTVAMTSDIVSQVEDSITDGHTTIAPSGNAVFDALALKATLASPTFTGTVTLPTTVLGETSFQLDPVISADGKWSGITETGTAGATLTFGQLCYFNSSSKWVLAKADSATTSSNLLGICVLAAAGDNSATEMLLYGKVNAAAQFPTLTIGAPVYISGATAGAIVTAQPTTTDYVIRVIGFAKTADELFFNPSGDYITHT